jgi:glutamate synthase (NADPH/NADH) small chain
MGDIQGYLRTLRRKPRYRAVRERLTDYREVETGRPDAESSAQASRCMDCGTPFCHSNCPLDNFIPEWNDLAFRGKWQEAWERLMLTSSFPEITGRLCPALCEGGCVLAYNDDAVTIRENELDIIERAFAKGLVKPRPPALRSGKKAAIIGSGPTALAAAARLNQYGHLVTVFERDERPGGFLRYGIPDFKLDKAILDRRIDLMKAEGIVFRCSVEAGKDIPAAQLKADFDAVLLAAGSRQVRDLKIPGRELSGVQLAVDYLGASNRRVSGEHPVLPPTLDAYGKRVVVIGGGDTGSDCVGTANRQGAISVHQLELLPRPPEERPANQPWPNFPRLYKFTSSHEEGVIQRFLVNTKRFIGEDGRLTGMDCVSVEWDMSGPAPVMKEVPGSEFYLPVDLAVLALGFAGAEASPLLAELGVALNPRGLAPAGDDFATPVPGVFAAGDMRRGQSLIVWAFQEGQKAAAAIDKALGGLHG